MRRAQIKTRNRTWEYIPRGGIAVRERQGPLPTGTADARSDLGTEKQRKRGATRGLATAASASGVKPSDCRGLDKGDRRGEAGFFGTNPRGKERKSNLYGGENGKTAKFMVGKTGGTSGGPTKKPGKGLHGSS